VTAQLVDPAAAVALVRESGRRVLTFIGFSGAGYEDEAAMLAAARTVLERFSPRDTIVNAGATAEGIGAVYRLAKALGFTTTGIVSSQALDSGTPISPFVDRVAYVADESWGGCVDETGRLSPTSRAMVEASDVLVAIGGGEIGRDELLAARRAGKPVEFVPAEMNHAEACSRAARKGEPEPRDFRGEVHRVFGGP
jgi:hypothetical protein